MKPDHTLDATGLVCPLPILKAKKALGGVPMGGILKVMATDPGAREDFEAFCRTTGNALIETKETDGVTCFLIRRTT